MREVAKPQLHSVPRRSSSNLLELESSRLDEPYGVHQVARSSEEQALRLDRERSLGSNRGVLLRFLVSEVEQVGLSRDRLDLLHVNSSRGRNESRRRVGHGRLALLLSVGSSFLPRVMLATFASSSSFDESVGEVSCSGSVLVEEDLDDSSGSVELEPMRVRVDERVEDVGGGVLGDHPEGEKEERAELASTERERRREESGGYDEPGRDLLVEEMNVESIGVGGI